MADLQSYLQRRQFAIVGALLGAIIFVVLVWRQEDTRTIATGSRTKIVKVQGELRTFKTETRVEFRRSPCSDLTTSQCAKKLLLALPAAERERIVVTPQVIRDLDRRIGRELIRRERRRAARERRARARKRAAERRAAQRRRRKVTPPQRLVPFVPAPPLRTNPIAPIPPVAIAPVTPSGKVPPGQQQRLEEGKPIPPGHVKPRSPEANSNHINTERRHAPH